MFPCYFGTDVPSKDQLVACNYTMDGIKELIGADSIGFLSVNSLELFLTQTVNSVTDVSRVNILLMLTDKI